MITTSHLNIAIVGAGRIGTLHAENLAHRIENARPAAVTDVVVEAAQEAAEQLNIPAAHQDYRAVLEDPAIHAVLICSSTDTHAQIVQEAAEAGKHVFCEKPIDLNLQRIQDVLQSVDRAGIKFQVGFNRRFDANFRRLKEQITNDKIGTPHVLKITSRDPIPPPLPYIKVSGGLFLDMTIHDFDMARYLVGGEVTEVYAVGDALIDPAIKAAGDIDTALVTLKFDSGVIGNIDNSRQAAYGYDQRIEVFGSKGMLLANNTTPDNVVLLDEHAAHRSNPHPFFIERYRDAYVAELQAFVDAILNDTPPLVTGIDGLMPLKIGLAAKKSLSEQRPVPITEIG